MTALYDLNIDMLRHITQQYKESRVVLWCTCKSFSFLSTILCKKKRLCNLIASNGIIPLLEWARDMGCKWNNGAHILAIREGHTLMFKYLLRHGSEYRCVEWMSAAAQYGRLDILQLMDSIGHNVTPRGACIAAKYGHIDIVMWAKTVCRGISNYELVEYAVRGRQLHMMSSLGVHLSDNIINGVMSVTTEEDHNTLMMVVAANLY